MTKREESDLVLKCSGALVRGTGFLLVGLVGMTSVLALLAALAVVLLSGFWGCGVPGFWPESV